MNGWKVGQQVWLIPSHNDRGSAREVRLVEITKVGSKYVYADDTQFSASDGIQKTNYPGSARAIRTPERHARVLRQEAANQRLTDLGLSYKGYGRWPWSVEALEQVINVLEDDAAIAAFKGE